MEIKSESFTPNTNCQHEAQYIKPCVGRSLAPQAVARIARSTGAVKPSCAAKHPTARLTPTEFRLEREVIAALVLAPGMLNFYIALIWKSRTVNGVAVRVPLFPNSRLSAQPGNRDCTSSKRFRQTIVSKSVRGKSWRNSFFVRTLLSRINWNVRVPSKGQSSKTQHEGSRKRATCFLSIGSVKGEAEGSFRSAPRPRRAGISVVGSPLCSLTPQSGFD